MIRGLLVGLLRIVFVVFVFYLVSTVVQSVLRAFSRGRTQPRFGQPDRSSQERESPSRRPIEYKDVKDASFTEVPDNSKHESPQQ